MADKARARGRTRARATAQQEPSRRPGMGSEPVAQPPILAQASVGRVARGAGQGDPTTARPGIGASTAQKDVAGLAGEMSGLAIQATGDNGSRGGGRGAWRGRNESLTVVSRPAHVVNKQGESGQPTNLVANYFAVTSKPEWAMYHYHVDYNPEVEGVRLRRALLHDHDQTLGKAYLFDGMALFTTKRLASDEMEFFSSRKSDDARIRIHLKLARELPPKDPVVMQICNIQMRRNMEHLKFTLLGRHYFDIKDSSEVKNQNMELWPGYMTAIHQHESSILMCAELTFKVLRLDTVYDQLLQLYQGNRGNYKDVAAKELIGSIVLTRYNNKTYRIDDIEWSKSPNSEFELKDKSMTNYVEYYAKHWNETVKDPAQPLLVSLPKKRDAAKGMGPILLVPELCIMTGLSEETRSNFSVMKEIALHTRKDPAERAAILQKFINRVQSNDDVKRDMAGWGLAFSNDLVKINGRNLPPENIVQANGARFRYKANTADWSQEMRSNVLFIPMPLKNWVLICTDRDSSLASDFLNTLKRVGPPMGIIVSEPQVVQLRSDRLNEYTGALQAKIISGVQLVLCVVPNNRKDRYDAIKKYCCIDNPVPSQVVVSRTISKRQMLMSVTTKIAIQLNCKLGGSAWALEIPRGRSVGGFCCSTDPSLTRYYSRVTFQTTHQEMVNGFQTNLQAAIRRYSELNDGLPERVFVYRDGVGEGQLQQVLEFELAQVQECFKLIGNYQPRLAFIVVTKRINTRIMERRGNTLSNPLPGTVVDSVITRPEWYDFFLVSQSVRQGTVGPTQYNVIFDSSDLRPDHIQKLTYKLTHLYFNWPGTIRVPAPCMYAHKLAFLTGQSLHGVPHANLADTLFFL